MRRLGRVLHLSSTHNLIIRAERECEPHPGEKVVDEHLKPVGIVYDVFGPVSKPYVSVKPRVEDPRRYLQHVLYSIPSKGR